MRFLRVETTGIPKTRRVSSKSGRSVAALMRDASSPSTRDGVFAAALTEAGADHVRDVDVCRDGEDDDNRGADAS